MYAMQYAVPARSMPDSSRACSYGPSALLGGFRCGRFLPAAATAHAPHEPLNLAARIDEALVTCEVRMAFGADLRRGPG